MGPGVGVGVVGPGVVGPGVDRAGVVIGVVPGRAVSVSEDIGVVEDMGRGLVDVVVCVDGERLLRRGVGAFFLLRIQLMA